MFSIIKFDQIFWAKKAHFGQKWASAKKRFSFQGIIYFYKKKTFSKTRINLASSNGALFLNLAFNFF